MEVISHTVWLYYQFSMSFRDVEELLAARGGHLRVDSVLVPDVGANLPTCQDIPEEPLKTSVQTNPRKIEIRTF